MDSFNSLCNFTIISDITKSCIDTLHCVINTYYELHVEVLEKDSSKIKRNATMTCEICGAMKELTLKNRVLSAFVKACST